MVGWHVRQLAHAVEWEVVVPGQPEPAALIRRVRIRGRVCFRAVSYARQPADRRLIGYYPHGDAAAQAAWRHYCDQRATQHQAASRLHGGRERGGPSADS